MQADRPAVHDRIRPNPGATARPPETRQAAPGHAGTLHRYRTRAARRRARHALGDKPVSDRRRDACFHDRMIHWPDARFATPPPTNGGAAKLVLSPKGTRQFGMVRTSEINGELCSAAGGGGRPPPLGSVRAGGRRVGLSCGSARTARPTRGRPSMAACLVLSGAEGASAARWCLPGSCWLVCARPAWW